MLIMGCTVQLTLFQLLFLVLKISCVVLSRTKILRNILNHTGLRKKFFLVHCLLVMGCTTHFISTWDSFWWPCLGVKSLGIPVCFVECFVLFRGRLLTFSHFFVFSFLFCFSWNWKECLLCFCFFCLSDIFAYICIHIYFFRIFIFVFFLDFFWFFFFFWRSCFILMVGSQPIFLRWCSKWQRFKNSPFHEFLASWTSAWTHWVQIWPQICLTSFLDLESLLFIL